MERRGFLKTLTAAVTTILAVKDCPVEAKPVEAVPVRDEYQARQNLMDYWERNQEIIVSPSQARAIESLYGVDSRPLSYGLIEQMERKARFR